MTRDMRPVGRIDSRQPSILSQHVWSTAELWTRGGQASSGDATEAMANLGIVPHKRIDGHQGWSPAQLTGARHKAESEAEKADAAAKHANQMQQDFLIAESLVNKPSITKQDLQNLLDGKVNDQSGQPINLNAVQWQSIERLKDGWDSQTAKTMMVGQQSGSNGARANEGHMTLDSVDAGKNSIDQKAADAHARAKLLEDAAKPTDKVLEAARLRPGEGYYQVSHRLLALDGKQHTHAVAMKLTRTLQDEAAAQTNGHNPTLSAKQPLVTEKNFDSIMLRLKSDAEQDIHGGPPMHTPNHAGKPISRKPGGASADRSVSRPRDRTAADSPLTIDVPMAPIPGLNDIKLY